jgi:alpha-glucosidase (family GH31 glycosyl hydrolase)
LLNVYVMLWPRQVWNLATEPAHYAGIVTVMHLRENLREYVANINAKAAATGLPMVRPMFLQVGSHRPVIIETMLDACIQFPNDTACQGADVEDQFMFGDAWLVRLEAVELGWGISCYNSLQVAPVYVYQATSRSVYLPVIGENEVCLAYECPV